MPIRFSSKNLPNKNLSPGAKALRDKVMAASARRRAKKAPTQAAAPLTQQQAQLDAALKAGANPGRVRQAATPAQVAQIQAANMRARQKANVGMQQARQAPAGTVNTGAKQLSPAQMARQLAEQRAKQLGINPNDSAAIQKSNQVVAQSMTPIQSPSGNGVVVRPKTATQMAKGGMVKKAAKKTAKKVSKKTGKK